MLVFDELEKKSQQEKAYVKLDQDRLKMHAFILCSDQVTDVHGLLSDLYYVETEPEIGSSKLVLPDA